MVVNAENIFALNHQARDYAIHELPAVERLLKHPAMSSIVVMNEAGDVSFEYYAQGNDRNSTFAVQSCTKTMGYILLNRALAEGKLSLDDKIEQYLPNIGSGYRGRTINDLASMQVHHNLDEGAAYMEDPVALALFDRDEAMSGLAPNPKRETAREFVQVIEAASENGSNEWQGGIVNYATINTTVLSMVIEAATGRSLVAQVRDILHDIGGENSVYMGTDYDGFPILGSSLLTSTVDFARYGRLLLADKEQLEIDRKAAPQEHNLVPADLTFVDAHYYKSAIHNDYGIGHSGWGGQVIWADPQSGTVVAMTGQIASHFAVPYEYYHLLFEATWQIIEHVRQQ